MEVAGIHTCQKDAVVVDGGVEAGHEHFFDFRSWRAECERSEKTGLGNEFQQPSHNASTKTWPMILRSPLPLIAGAGEIEEELLPGGSRNFLDDRIFLQLPWHSRHTRNDGAHAVAEGCQRVRICESGLSQ